MGSPFTFYGTMRLIKIVIFRLKLGFPNIYPIFSQTIRKLNVISGLKRYIRIFDAISLLLSVLLRRRQRFEKRFAPICPSTLYLNFDTLSLECIGKLNLLKAQFCAFNTSDSTTIPLTVQKWQITSYVPESTDFVVDSSKKCLAVRNVGMPLCAGFHKNVRFAKRTNQMAAINNFLASTTLCLTRYLASLVELNSSGRLNKHNIIHYFPYINSK